MGLAETFRKAALQAVAAFGDVAVSATYAAFSSATYNASAGTPVTVFSSTAGVSVIFEEFRIDQVDGAAVRPEDKKALVPAKNISGVTPSVNDQLIVTGSVAWSVVRVTTDPAEALWTLQIRRP